MRRTLLALTLSTIATTSACGDDDATGRPDEDAFVADGAIDAAPDADTGTSPDASAGDAAAPPPPPARVIEPPLVAYVDPFIGTGGLGFGVGSTFPGPQRPFGMVRPGPDTTEPDGALLFEHCSGYDHDDSMVLGFSLTRMHGTGIADYGVPGFMPTVGMTAAKTHQDGSRALLDKETEVASPGYYRVTVGDDAASTIDVELTATDRVAFARFRFPESARSDATVLFDMAHVIGDGDIGDGEVTIDRSANLVTGFSVAVGGYSGRFGGMPVYFAARASREPVAHGVWQAGALHADETTRRGPDVGAWLSFDATADREVVLAIGISFTDVAHAVANLDAEQGDLDFDRVRAESESVWEEALSRLEISARSERDARMTYTALYHTLLMPTLASDADGTYRGLDGEVHESLGHRYYTDLSLWDTFRTLHPWLTLAYPEYQLDFVRSLVAMGRDDGYVPRWPLGIGETGGMLGDSGAIVIADSWIKGVRDFDLAEVWVALRRKAMGPAEEGYPGGRGGIVEFMDLGYVPIESGGSSASATLEYAYADFALARLADALGETEDAAHFRERAGYWRNLYDPDRGFLLGRHADGRFPAEVDLEAWEDFYAEGNAWQYTWYAPHDLEGLAEAMGGRDTMLERLDDLFARSARARRTALPDTYYWQGNEPDLHVAWMYSAFDDPERSARWARWIVETRYGDGPDGLPGNDDGGTMSAWYLFAMLGLYPIAAETYYLLAPPILPRAVLHLPGGDLVVSAPDAAAEPPYPLDVALDGESLPRPRVEHDSLIAGARIEWSLPGTP
ncbi:MAG: GH92 family glycosyl hydrolase [Deltaproteobacteria bacterium]|nr:GH92 family glycosyl hydrolase [Deltaproteobacteria bacterium]